MFKCKLLTLLLSLFLYLAPALALSTDQHEKLKLGMTIDEVTKILESSGKEMTYPNLPANQKIFRWKEGKSWISVTFVDGKVGGISSTPDLATAEQRRIREKFKAK